MRTWVWVFSSTHSTPARWGGSRYRPTTARAIRRVDQWAASGGVSSKVLVITASTIFRDSCTVVVVVRLCRGVVTPSRFSQCRSHPAQATRLLPRPDAPGRQIARMYCGSGVQAQSVVVRALAERMGLPRQGGAVAAASARSAWVRSWAPPGPQTARGRGLAPGTGSRGGRGDRDRVRPGWAPGVVTLPEGPAGGGPALTVGRGEGPGGPSAVVQAMPVTSGSPRATRPTASSPGQGSSTARRPRAGGRGAVSGPALAPRSGAPGGDVRTGPLPEGPGSGDGCPARGSATPPPASSACRHNGSYAMRTSGYGRAELPSRRMPRLPFAPVIWPCRSTGPMASRPQRARKSTQSGVPAFYPAPGTAEPRAPGLVCGRYPRSWDITGGVQGADHARVQAARAPLTTGWRFSPTGAG